MGKFGFVTNRGRIDVSMSRAQYFQIFVGDLAAANPIQPKDPAVEDEKNTDVQDEDVNDKGNEDSVSEREALDMGVEGGGRIPPGSVIHLGRGHFSHLIPSFSSMLASFNGAFRCQIRRLQNFVERKRRRYSRRDGEQDCLLERVCQ